MKEIIELSWQTQVVLVGGYIAYVIAYSGQRTTHKTFDTLLIILCFGGLGSIVLGFFENWLPRTNNYKEEFAAVSAVLTSIFGGIVWRAHLRKIAVSISNFLSGSEDDGLFTAWETLTQTNSYAYSQINVTTKSGRELESYLLGDLGDLPNGPCVLGGDGSLAIYVTHITDKDGIRREAKNLNDDDGSRMTFIPAAEIVEVDFRRKPKSIK